MYTSSQLNHSGFTGREVATKIQSYSGPTRIVCRYHSTPVAVWFTDQQRITLNTGGYFTATTKRRMNQFAEEFNLPYRVFQHKGEWFVHVYHPEIDATLEFLSPTIGFSVVPAKKEGQMPLLDLAT